MNCAAHLPYRLNSLSKAFFSNFSRAIKKSQDKEKGKRHYELDKNRKPFLETSTLSSFRLTRPRESNFRFRIETFGTFCTF